MILGNLATPALQSWAVLNDVEFPAATVAVNILDRDGNSKGGGLVATRDVSAGEVLLKVPKDLIVSREQVGQCAKVDATLRQLLAAVEPFAKVGWVLCGIKGRHRHLRTDGTLADTAPSYYGISHIPDDHGKPSESFVRWQ
jgi:hypothetical protein